MKLSVRPVLIVLFTICSGAASAQDLPEKSTDSLKRHDSLVQLFTSMKTHTLSSVRTKPEAYRALPVQIEIQFHEPRKMGNPFFTRFTEDNYYCFAAWGVEQALWDREEYQKDFPFLFVDRKSVVCRTFVDAKIYDRLRVKAVVRDVFRGIPYVEVTEADVLDDSITEATILHGAKAKKLAKEGDTAGALAEFERAMRGSLADITKAQFHIDMAEVYFQRSERDNAISHLEKAKKLQPEDLAIAHAVEKIQALPAGSIRMDEVRQAFGEIKNASASLKVRDEKPASRPARDIPGFDAKAVAPPGEKTTVEDADSAKPANPSGK
jgi:tetratricopeptide (TPR) repeat protein